jgi:phage/plasmid-associated DNA primase
VAKLTTRDELEGLLVRAVVALRRLMDRGRFDPPPSCRQAAGAYRDRLDTVRGFVSESCTLHAEAWVSRPALYRSYREWAKDSGRMALSAESFNEHLQRNWPEHLCLRTRRGTRGWAGIGLAAEVESEETAR